MKMLAEIFWVAILKQWQVCDSGNFWGVLELDFSRFLTIF